jgi:hypothetical protein
MSSAESAFANGTGPRNVASARVVTSAISPDRPGHRGQGGRAVEPGRGEEEMIVG